MNKYIAWDEDSGMALTINSIKDLIPSPFKHSSLELYQFTGKTDIHGDEIYYDFHVIKYKVRSGNCWKERIGIFHFNEDTLRAEIDIVNPKNVAPAYYEIGNMKDFEIIGNVKENSELIGG